MVPDMDCKHFRKLHLAYLDDTLPGTQMAAAQRHVLQCDGCAAHDTLVRRSLMIARSMPAIEPSAAFQRKLRERLAACREEFGDPRQVLDDSTRRPRSARTLAVVAAGAVLGALAVHGWRQARVTPLSSSPVMALDATFPQGMLRSASTRDMPVFGAPVMASFGPTVGYLPVTAKQITPDTQGNGTETSRKAMLEY